MWGIQEKSRTHIHDCHTVMAQDTAEACCEACRQVMDCNIFVWCSAPGGCGGSKHRECWLKRQKRINYIDPDGTSGAGACVSCTHAGMAIAQVLLTCTRAVAGMHRCSS